MALIAVIGRDLSGAMRVNTYLQFTALASGELHFFANDLPTKSADKNNDGVMSIKIYRIDD